MHLGFKENRSRTLHNVRNFSPALILVPFWTYFSKNSRCCFPPMKWVVKAPSSWVYISSSEGGCMRLNLVGTIPTFWWRVSAWGRHPFLYQSTVARNVKPECINVAVLVGDIHGNGFQKEWTLGKQNNRYKLHLPSSSSAFTFS